MRTGHMGMRRRPDTDLTYRVLSGVRAILTV